MNRSELFLEKYSIVECGQPILFRHIFKRFYENKSVRVIAELAFLENDKKDFCVIGFFKVMKLTERDILKKKNIHYI